MALWLLGSFAVRAYLSSSFRSKSAYGSLTSAPIAALLFFYVTALAVLIGAELNSAIDHLRPLPSTVEGRMRSSVARTDGASAVGRQRARRRGKRGRSRRRHLDGPRPVRASDRSGPPELEQTGVGDAEMVGHLVDDRRRHQRGRLGFSADLLTDRAPKDGDSVRHGTYVRQRGAAGEVYALIETEQGALNADHCWGDGQSSTMTITFSIYRPSDSGISSSAPATSCSNSLAICFHPLEYRSPGLARARKRQRVRCPGCLGSNEALCSAVAKCHK